MSNLQYQQISSSNVAQVQSCDSQIEMESKNTTKL